MVERDAGSPSRGARAHPARRIEAEHRTLHAQLDALVDAADRAGMQAGLEGLPERIAKHFADEEGAGGLYESVAARRPALQPRLDVLRADHREILEGLHALTRALQSQVASGAETRESTRAALARCLRRLRLHELAESEMIAMVYYGEDGGRG